MSHRPHGRASEGLAGDHDGPPAWQTTGTGTFAGLQNAPVVVRMSAFSARPVACGRRRDAEVVPVPPSIRARRGHLAGRSRAMTITAERSGQYALGDRLTNRLGYGTMRLTGPDAAGRPPPDHKTAIAVLRRAVDLGVDHVDTGDYEGPHKVTDLIRKALHPYPVELTVTTSVGARWTSEGRWVQALSPDELHRAVQDHLDHLGADVLDVVHLRMPGFPEPVELSPAEPMETLAELQQQGLIRHLGVSNVTTQGFADAEAIARIVCVQNHYDVAHRHDDPLVDALARLGIPFVACSPLGGFPPISAPGLARVAAALETTESEVALTWLLARSPNILPIPSTRTIAHLEQNLEAGARVLGPVELGQLDRIGGVVQPDADL
jgi:aryl-alcohol dehydrogenase-like predicted oxidoreductase